MSSSCDLYTAHAMRKVEIEGVTTEATGHPIEFAFDWNLDTYWAPTTTGVNAMYIDLQDAYDIDGLALFIRNYDTDFGTEAVELSYSDNGSDWTVSNAWYLIADGGAVGQPIKVFPVITQSAHRWWRVTFGGTITQIVQVAQVILYNKTSIGQGSQFPESDVIEYLADVTTIDGGLSFKKQTAYLPIRTLRREWLFTAQAGFDSLATVIDRCLLSGLPLILVEGSNRYLVEISDSGFNHAELGYIDYRPAVTFVTVPYIADGKGF